MKADNPLTMGRRKKNGITQVYLLELPGIARYSKRLFNGKTANPARVKKATLATLLRNKVAPRCVMYS